MTIIIFFIILGLLVLVHEMGHFLFAKRAGVRVDEFGFGYPPRAFKIGRKWDTDFTVNWIPFGGFVKIFGENYEEAETDKSQKEDPSPKVLGSPLRDSTRLFSKDIPSGSEEQSKPLESASRLRFTQVSKRWQAAILVAGVTFNILFAWFLFSLGFIIGVPSSVENNFGGEVKNPVLTIIEVLPEYPAAESGLRSGDKIISVSNTNSSLENTNPEEVSSLINSSLLVNIKVDRGGEEYEYKITPKEDVDSGRRVVGISMDMVGTVSLPIHKAIIEGAKTTVSFTYLTVEGLYNLLIGSIKGGADFSNISGPVGIVGIVGDATRLGFSYLLTLTALISINLAIINLVPFPALDGGRLLFVLIESIKRSPINPKIASWTNAVGFALLLLLMVFITFRDIAKL